MLVHTRIAHIYTNNERAATTAILWYTNARSLRFQLSPPCEPVPRFLLKVCHVRDVLRVVGRPLRSH